MRQVAVRRLHPVNVNHAAICPVVHPFRSYGLVTFVTINAGGQEFPPLTRLLGQPGIIVQHGPPYFYIFFFFHFPIDTYIDGDPQKSYYVKVF